MKIEVFQTYNEGKNEFEVKFDNNLKYYAKLPFISINDPLNLEKIRKIKIYDLNNKEIYITDYKYLDNKLEELIPFKFLVTGSQKFNQLLFCSDKNVIKIYYECNDILDNRYVIELNEKKYFCFSVEDGYIRHMPIYDDEVQIGEILKSNVVIDEKDEYVCYLKKGYESLADAVVALMLYLDRSRYSSSYLINKSYKFTKSYSFNKNNKYYDNEWVKNNFGDEFYLKVDKDLKLVKEKLKHPVMTFKEQWASMSPKQRKLLKFIILAPWILMLIVGLFIGIIFLIIYLT